MRSTYLLVAALGSLVQAGVISSRQASNSTNSTASSSGSVQIINVDDEPSGALNLTAWALLYTYPLVSYYAFLAGETLPSVGTNALANQLYLASPADTSILQPNVDVLYSRVILDLSQQNVVLTVPNYTSDRYAVWPVYDAFSNVVAELGTANGSPPGDYLIRATTDLEPTLGLTNATVPGNSTAFGSQGINGTTYRGIITVPTTYASMLVRFEVLTNSTDDINAIHALQNATKLTPVNRTGLTQGDSQPAPSLQSLAPNGTFLGIDSPQAQLSFAASLVPWNQPEIYSQRYRVASILARAGLYNGSYHQLDGVNLTQAAVVANTSGTADLRDPAHLRVSGNNWTNPIVAYQSNFSYHYGAAGATSWGGGQGQTVKQTLYPTYNGSNSFSIGADNAFLITFSGKPPVDYPGFWSLSIYGANRQLVPNDLFRFKVGSNSFNLVYEDGTAIYGSNATNFTNKPFQVLVQSSSIPPPSNWSSNWLPSDPSGKFTWLLRWYLPSPAFTNGSYVYPQVNLIPALRSNLTSSQSASVTASSSVTSSQSSSTASRR